VKQGWKIDLKNHVLIFIATCCFIVKLIKTHQNLNNFKKTSVLKILYFFKSYFETKLSLSGRTHARRENVFDQWSIVYLHFSTVYLQFSTTKKRNLI